jgi:predicted O-methyltransferase YrrM
MTRNDTWTAVDDYISHWLTPSDPALAAALAANAAAGLPPIDITPSEGKFLHLVARLIGSRKILEIGTLGGYSTIWLARALPEGGRLITLEANAKHAEVARANIARAGLSGVVDLRLGPALETLVQLERENIAPFDLMFVDADKANNPEYVHWALRFSRPGSVIVVDNVVRDGAVLESDSSDADIQGVRRMFEMLAAEPRLSGTALQTVGKKGYDGFVFAVVSSA